MKLIFIIVFCLHLIFDQKLIYCCHTAKERIITNSAAGVTYFCRPAWNLVSPWFSL